MKARARGILTRFGFCMLMAGAAFAQQVPQPRYVPLREPARPLLSAGDLDTLVAPITLLSGPAAEPGGLAASTYPLELVVAQQWLEQHQNLQGPQLIDAAKQMNWDASVQAMVAFPEVLRKLTQNVSWTTDLGNAFLSQQAGVLGCDSKHASASARQWAAGKHA